MLHCALILQVCSLIHLCCCYAAWASLVWEQQVCFDYGMLLTCQNITLSSQNSVLSAACLFLQSKRGERDGNDTESADEQTGSPLHVLSDIAQREGELEARPEAAANGADSQLSPRMQTRSGSNAAAGEGRSASRHHVQSLQQSVNTAVVIDLWWS